MDPLDSLPGAELIQRGLEDLHAGRYRTVEALLVAIAEPRLRRLGLDLPSLREVPSERELELYRLLCGERAGDAYSRYNALLRRLVSFEQALEHRLRRQRSGKEEGASP